jgi:hypothetical protein
VAGEEAAAVFSREERSNLRRHEACELRPLSLHRLEELRVGDRNRALIRERRHQLDLPVVEWSNVTPTYLNHANQVVLDQHREAEHRPNVGHLDRGKVTLGVGGDIGNMHRTFRQGDAPNDRLGARPHGV